MAIEMIGGDVEKRADARIERRRKIDLERRTFDDVNGLVGRRRQFEHGHADIAAHLGRASRLAQDMRDQRRRRRLAVGAGDGDQRRVGRARRPFAGEKLDIADHLDAGCARALHGPVRLGMGQRHAGRENKRGKVAPVGGVEIDRRKARFAGAGARCFVVIPGGDLHAAGDERAQRRQAGAAETEQRDAPTAKDRDRSHPHLSLRVERPTIASTKAMIQKRMTICGSDQPSCSK